MGDLQLQDGHLEDDLVQSVLQVEDVDLVDSCCEVVLGDNQFQGDNCFEMVDIGNHLVVHIQKEDNHQDLQDQGSQDIQV